MKLIPALLLAASLAATALSSTAAFAQSRDEAYRRGYEQGWRDAMDSVRDGGRRAEPRYEAPRYGIVIEEARYGAQGRFCDARNRLQSMVGSRTRVEVEVDNDICGDPIKDVPKRMHVRYRCGNSESASVEAREHDVILLQCR